MADMPCSLCDGIADNKISKITKSTSETNPSKSDPSSFRNPTQIIKVASFHQLMPCPWNIFTIEGLGPGQENDCVLQKPHIANNSSCGFENFDEGQTFDKVLRMKSNVDTYGDRFHIYYTVTYLDYL